MLPHHNEENKTTRYEEKYNTGESTFKGFYFFITVAIIQNFGENCGFHDFINSKASVIASCVSFSATNGATI